MRSLVDLGKLKNPIEIQSLEVTADEYGFQTEEWTTILRTRAMVEFDKSYKLNKEVWGSEGVETFTTRIFTFRSHPRISINTRQRILFKGVAYQIYIVNDMDEEGRFIQVWANTIC